MDEHEQPTHPRNSRLAQARSELFEAFDEELAHRIADARSETSTALIAEIEVLRLQLRDLQERDGERSRALDEAERRLMAVEKDRAEVENALKLARNGVERTEAEAVEQRRRAEHAESELTRIGEAGALVSTELLSISEIAEDLRAENRRLQEQLLDSSVQRRLEHDSLALAGRAREEELFARLVGSQAQARAALELSAGR